MGIFRLSELSANILPFVASLFLSREDLGTCGGGLATVAFDLVVKDLA